MTRAATYLDGNTPITRAYLTAGTYTPTATAQSNVAACEAFSAMYFRIGELVHVSGTVDINATADTSRVLVRLSLPIASNFGNVLHAAGIVALSETDIALAGTISSDDANDAALLSIMPPDSDTWAYTYSYTYRIIE